ncbi:SapC family protein [Shewanella sp. D64]|uniref:SapC family protein n=1 Tax=unclassified Shewanella TaxID=196818 RepID=UPI0022BA67A6|nr:MULTISPECIES: SapC family protein [unclassified Shewanella]MEC4727794.1 SapC family protein [Shewanella sp. D64]MEC4739331.1 SapC family protein [Shewanella sp. E94]WBJ97012.1 SapC family protein [Shewanella sp. MTB7]
MTNISPLNSTVHLNTAIKESKDYRRFAAQSLIPVVVQEFAILATEFPIVFVKNTENGQFTPIAMMGINNNFNLYCQTENWDASVTPIGFSKSPLSLMQTSQNSEEVMVFIDEKSELVTTDEGDKLFDKSGEQTEYLKKRSNALLDLASFTQQTAGITKYFADLNLLTPKQLTVKLSSDSPQVNIDGVYIIDEKALRELKDEEFLTLKSKGLLPLIYAHLTSLHQIARLITKQNEFDETQS